MFAAIALVCGLTVMSPTINEGCGLIYVPTPFSTGEECVAASMAQLPSLESRLPQGAYVADLTCAQLDKGV